MSFGLVVALGGLLAFTESLIGVGIVLPGEIMISGLAVTAAPHQTPMLGLAVVVGAVLGDQLNYRLGRRLGPRLPNSRLVRWIGRAHWDRGLDLVHRHGALAVLLSRLLPVVRTLIPAVAGVAGLSATRFAVASLAGSLAWTSLWVGAGSLAAGLLRGSLQPLLLLVPAAVVALAIRRRRASRRAAEQAPTTASAVLGDRRTRTTPPSTDLGSLEPQANRTHREGISAMSRLAHLCARRRLVVISLWFVAVIALGGAVGAAGSNFTNATTMPDSESGTAYKLLAQLDGGKSADEKSGNIVWQTHGVDVDDPAVRAQVNTVLTQITAMPGVSRVVSPYSKAGAAQLSTADNVAYASVTVSSTADVDPILDAAKSLDSASLDLQTGGRAFTEDPAASPLTELIGVLGALVVLLLMFRSIWAALLPIITGVVGVIASLLLVTLASHVVDLADSTPTMGALIGLGVGIDYALFIVNRYRKALMAGESVPNAISQALNTSGRAVLFAGGTVIIALLGMFVVQIDILTGMARGAALTVVLTVAAAVTLLPALLSLLGRRVLSRRQRAALAGAADGTFPSDGRSPSTNGTHAARRTLVSRWTSLVERRPRSLAIVATLLMLALAVPALGLRLGSADASSDPSDSSTHSYFTTMSNTFGEGFEASLLVVASTPDAASATAFTALAKRMESVEDVTSVSVGATPDGSPVSVATVIPASSAQTESTADLVTRLREDVIPGAEQGTNLQVYVGGTTASNIDNGAFTTEKLPIYLALIALLGFLLLVIAFRSILVPLIGALANLLTLAVALGAVTAIFQLGWGSELLGVGTAAPIESLVPVLVIGVMFGLSMDYQVFLVSRMHEEWTHTRDNARSIRVGMLETGQVIATAAIIMLCVFASFGFSGQRIIAQIGIGLAVAVLADAFVLRMTVVPALMHLIGRRNWAYPQALERITPQVSIEGGGAPEPEVATDAEEPVLVAVGTTDPAEHRGAHRF